MNLRIIFAGTPDFAAGNLQALIRAGYKPIAVYSQPDRPKGRGKKLIASPVKQIAIEHNIAVHQPRNFKLANDMAQLKSLNADIIIVVAYGLLLPKAVLNIPMLGCINVHASLLPRWRGAAPIERALEAGDNETGITVMQMDEGLDTGNMLTIRKLAINSEMTGDTLRERLLTIGVDALMESLEQLKQGNAKPEVQDDAQATYAHKLTKAEAELDWHQCSATLVQKIHAFNSANTCYAFYHGERIKISQVTAHYFPPEALANTQPGEIIELDKKSLIVATLDGALSLKEVQLPNAKRMTIAAVLNGRASFFHVGDRFIHSKS